MYYDFVEPEGYALTGEIHRFYPDRLRDAYTGHVGFSGIAVQKPERMIVRAVEYHTRTSEIILPLNDDIVLHVAPATNGVPAPEETHAFLVPKGDDGATEARRVAPLPAAGQRGEPACPHHPARMHLCQRLHPWWTSPTRQAFEIEF